MTLPPPTDRPPPREGVVRAAGGIVWRPGRHGPEVLLVHRPRYDDWTLPKGKAEPGEHDRETALREVEEETGRACRIDGAGPVAETRYLDHRGRDKRVVYFLMRPSPVPTAPRGAAGQVADGSDADLEVDVARWFGVEEGRRRLTYERDRPLLDHVPRSPAGAPGG